MNVDIRSYCRRCHRDDLPHGILCNRESILDNGADRDQEYEPARFEGVCMRCCAHNHA